MAPYDIFLSFRGPDTRKKFTDHLYNALTHKGYRTFRDNDEIERGEPIKSELRKAIGNSKIFVVILSKNYANSTACLFELQMILEQWKKSDHFVLPVFYEVDPLEVKKQAKHLHFGKKEVTHEKVKGWRAALEEIAGMAGMVSQNQCNGEAEFIEEIVDELNSQLRFWDHIKACLKRGACTITGGKHHHHHHNPHHHHHGQEDKQVVDYAKEAQHHHHHHNPHHHHHGQEDKQLVDYAKEAQRHKHNEHLAERTAIAAGAYAVHEKHMIKKDPAHAQMHKIEGGIATAVAVAARAYALHEHHEAKEAKKHMKHHHHHRLF